MAKKKDLYPSNAWEYADWLYTSHRLTAEEHMKLKNYLIELEAASFVLSQQGC